MTAEQLRYFAIIPVVKHASPRSDYLTIKHIISFLKLSAHCLLKSATATCQIAARSHEEAV